MDGIKRFKDRWCTSSQAPWLNQVLQKACLGGRGVKLQSQCCVFDMYVRWNAGLFAIGRCQDFKGTERPRCGLLSGGHLLSSLNRTLAHGHALLRQPSFPVALAQTRGCCSPCNFVFCKAARKQERVCFLWQWWGTASGPPFWPSQVPTGPCAGCWAFSGYKGNSLMGWGWRVPPPHSHPQGCDTATSPFSWPKWDSKCRAQPCLVLPGLYQE